MTAVSEFLRSIGVFLPALQLLFVIVILIWDVVLTGRIGQVRNLPRAFVYITALAGFLLLPALFIHLAMSDATTARSVSAVAWVWPLALVLFAIQALYAAVRRLVNPFLGFFISLYDVVIATDAVLRYIAASGTVLPTTALVFLGATSGAFAFAMQSSTIMASPFFFFAPMTAPAFPALRSSVQTLRFGMAVVAFVWIGFIMASVPESIKAVRSYRAHDSAREKLQERPAGDFDVGIKLFSDLSSGPAPITITNDLSLADSLGVTVVSVTVIPERMTKVSLDSIADVLDDTRNDSTQLIVTMGYDSKLFGLPGRNFSVARRVAAIEPIVRILKPDILLPALDPYEAGTRAAGSHPPKFWEDYLTKASAAAKLTRPKTRIGVAASSYDALDEELYKWAAASGSPIDVVGFSLHPTATGTGILDADHSAADRWMKESQSVKDHWIFSASGYPGAHGEESQVSAVWDALVWATSRPAIKGVIVADADDYGSIRGIRAADGHLRRVAFAIMRAMKGLRETAAPDSVPAPLKVQQRVGG